MFRRLLDSPTTYFVAAGLMVLVAVAAQFDLSFPSRTAGEAAEIRELRDRDDLNLVFIVVDTLRADRVGVYGYERPTTENLDALAQHGIVFRDVLAQSSWTKTSMASLWTGTLPFNNGILRFGDALPTEARLPAEILRDAGFRTAGIYRNGWVAPNFGFDQGFEFYQRPRPGRSRMEAESRHPAGGTLEGSDEDSLVAAMEFLHSFGNERFFLYMHMMDLHQYRYAEGTPDFGSSYSDYYDMAIHWTDRVIGHLHEQLRKSGQLQNTIIVIASDHGEAFREHGFEGHARNLFTEVVNVPWIIGLPFQLDPGVVIDEPVSNIDIWPTLLDLMGLPGLTNPDGRSLVPLILERAGVQDSNTSWRRPQFAYLDRGWGWPEREIPIVAVTDSGRKLVWWPKLDPPEFQLFDTEADPGEQTNLYVPGDPDTERLFDAAREKYESPQNAWGVEARQVELDEMRLNQLRALGYAVPRQR